MTTTVAPNLKPDHTENEPRLTALASRIRRFDSDRQEKEDAYTKTHRDPRAGSPQQRRP